MTPERRTAAMFLSPLAPMLRRTGHDPATVFAGHGIALQDTMNPEAKVTVQDTAALLAECESLLGDPSLGINMARHAEYSTFGALGLALAAGGDLRSVLHRIVRFHRLISDAVSTNLSEDDDRLGLHLVAADDTAPHPQALLFVLAIIQRMVRIRLPCQGDPVEVVTPDIPPAMRAAIQRYFRCQVSQGDHFALLFHRHASQLQLAASDPQLAAMLDATLTQRLADAERGALSTRLSLWIEERLPEGEPSLSDAASLLNMSVRSLQRRLKDEDLTWQQLIENTRRVLVERHLRQPGMSITQLAFLLGFADVSSFSRAFRKWYGASPSQLR
ncbi:MAG: AraC family transcriptional regulator ligand-binding domain-containing protein [Alcanivoracaceae bacterium]